jgi:hypothetical protein
VREPMLLDMMDTEWVEMHPKPICGGHACLREA